MHGIQPLRPGAEAANRRLAWLVGIAALAIGAGAAFFYFLDGLTLVHHDARARLVVARRIADSLTPGWRQIGAVWLPLPHLLNAGFVQVDLFYRTGASAVAFSVLSYAVAAWAGARLVLRATASRAAALVAVGGFALNPNVLYLQSTPMTEPLLLGLTLFGLDRLHLWVARGGPAMPHAAGLAFAGACLTRYEAWPITAAGCLIAALVFTRRGEGVVAAAWRASRLLPYPGVAVAGFLLLSRATVGAWLVTGGFFVPEGPMHGAPLLAGWRVWEGLVELSGLALPVAAVVSGLALLWRASRLAGRADLLLLLAPLAAAALPVYAFTVGHPFRVRYAVPLVWAAALLAGAGIGLLPRARALAAAVVVALTLVQGPPLDRSAAMVREATRDWPEPEREALVEFLAARYDGERVLVSMGSLAHVMQQLSHAGLALREFVHEGNGRYWMDAVARPEGHVGWVLLRETDTEGRDALLARLDARPDLLDGFERVLEAAGVALYRRLDAVVDEGAVP